MSERGTTGRGVDRHDPEPDIAAYALGVLDPEERDAVEAHLLTCATCRAELDRHERVVGDLGWAVPPVAPRPELRTELLGEIDGGPSATRLTLLHRRVPAIWLGIAAAIAILALGVLGAIHLQTRDDLREARWAERAIADYLKDGGTLSALMPAPDAPGEAAPGHGTLIVAPDQNGAMLVVYDLPPSEDGRTYRAWAERGGERVDLGDLEVNDQGTGLLYLYGPEPMYTYETVGLSLVTPDNPDGETFLVAPVDRP